MSPKQRVKRDILLEINEVLNFTDEPIAININTLWDSLNQVFIVELSKAFMLDGLNITDFIELKTPYKNDYETQVRAIQLTDTGWVGWFCFYDHIGKAYEVDKEEWLDSIFELKRTEKEVITIVPTFTVKDVYCEKCYERKN